MASVLLRRKKTIRIFMQVISNYWCGDTSLVEYLNCSQVTGLPPKTSPKYQLTGLTGSCLLLTTLLCKISFAFLMNFSKNCHENWLPRPHLPVVWHQARPIWLILKIFHSNTLLHRGQVDFEDSGCWPHFQTVKNFSCYHLIADFG